MQQNPEAVIQDLQTKDKTLFEWIGKLEVTDEASQKNAENLLADAKFSLKRATESQKFLLEPIKEADKRIRDLFRPYLDRLSLAVSRINTVLGNYHQEQLKIARESEAYAMAEQAAKLADAKESGEVVDLTPAETVAAPAKTSRAEMSTTSYIEDFDIIIVNPALVPRDCCEPSMRLLRARVKSGVRQIDGVLITPKTNIRTIKPR